MLDMHGDIQRTNRCKERFFLVFNMYYFFKGWLRGTAVERRSLAGELSLSCLDL